MPIVFLPREALLLAQALPSLARTQRNNPTVFTETFFFETLAYWLSGNQSRKNLTDPGRVKRLLRHAGKETSDKGELGALYSILKIGVDNFWPGRQTPKT